MIVLIDNGHGENTPGKCSPDKRLREYKKAREIARRLVNTLLSNGVEAHLLVPEETDVSLAERCKRANKYCDKYGAKNVLLVSIHHNAAGADGQWKSAGGWCIYTSPGQTSADLLATDLWNAAEESLKDYIGSFDAHKANVATTTASRNPCVPTGATKTPTMRHASTYCCIPSAQPC